MQEICAELESFGHEVKLPPSMIEDDHGQMISVLDYYTQRKKEANDDSWIWQRKSEAMRSHFKKVEWADVILVANEDKRGIQSYIGANTLLEMGLAFHLGKPIYLLNKIPNIESREEILGMKSIELYGSIAYFANMV